MADIPQFVNEVLAPAPGFTDNAPRYNLVDAQGQVFKENLKIVLQNVVDTMGTPIDAPTMNAIVNVVNALVNGTVAAGNATKLNGKTEGSLSVSYAATAGSAVDQTARNSAASAASAASNAQTTANNAMPKSGGDFTGNVRAPNTNRQSGNLMNAYVQTPDGTNTTSAYIIFRRK